jgi:two-component sensor histidine kinase
MSWRPMPQSTVLCRRRKVRFVSSGRARQIRSCSAGSRQEAHAPTRQGFGTDMMQAMIRANKGGDVRLNWHADGLTCEIILPT